LSFVDDGRPKAALIEGRDGTLYGSAMGYKYLGGRLFKINKNGSGYTVLYSFPRIESDSGAQPNGLAQGNDGALYGTTQNGGSSSEGSVFTLTTEGNAYTVLHNFSTSGGDGQSPQAALVEGSEGALYGTTAGGGSNGQGTVFKLNKDGSTYRVLYSFNGSDGAGPYGRLVEGRDGALYGTTSRRGENDAGAVFKLNKDGSSYRVLHSFSGSDGAWHYGGLVEGSDGVLYGTTSGGGSAGMGTVFKLNKSGSGYSVLRSFSTNGIDGQYPVAALVEGSDGGLYGTTRYGGTHGGGTVLKLNKDGSAYSLLHSFDGFDAGPQSALLRGSDGGLYGTTPYGGNNNAGTIFKLNQDGSGYTVLLRFSTSGDSQNPIAALTEGSDGALYGTASYGGGYGGGAVFKVNKDGSLYSVLHSFNSPYDGGRPEAGLLKGSDGAFYGTTFWGGELESGTVFKLFSSTPIVAITRLQLDGVGTRLSFSGGSAGQMFRIETKTDLNAPLWQTIATNQFGIDGKSQFLDTSASNYPTRFYRSATP